MQTGVALLIKDFSENLPKFAHFRKLIYVILLQKKGDGKKRGKQPNLFIDCHLLDDARHAELIITASLS